VSRVALNLLTLVPGRIGGSETYARSLCAALADVATGDVEALVSRLAPDAGSGLSTRIIDAYPAGSSPVARLAAYGAARLLPGVRRELELERYDVVHFPLTAMVPPANGTATVVTVHDVQHLVMPGYFSTATRAYRRLAYTTSTRRATRVIAISTHVAETLVERLGIPTEQITVVHSGIDHTRFAPPAAANVREPILLYPSFPWRHKNHPRLFEAFALVRRRHPDLRLVLTGPGHAPQPPSSGIDVRGYVSLDELVSLYRRASALVFPSLYEGFGQPLLEAMASGCPVAASNASAIPEICGGAARLFDATGPEAIAEAIEDVLATPAPWVERGLARAATFSWEATARSTEGVYREVA
jgi:glycosyltransferase involved in cell wall biosynthesis